MTKKAKQPRHYTPRASEPRHKTGITILQSVWSYILQRAEEWGLTPNAAYERIAVEHRAMTVEDGVYQGVIEEESNGRQRARLIAEIDRLVREIKELEDEQTES